MNIKEGEEKANQILSENSEEYEVKNAWEKFNETYKLLQNNPRSKDFDYDSYPNNFVFVTFRYE